MPFILQSDRLNDLIRIAKEKNPKSPCWQEGLFVDFEIDSSGLLIEFAHYKRDEIFGPKVVWDAEFCEMPTGIPELVRQKPQGFFNIDTSAFELDRLNNNFFRELAEFEFVRRLFRPVRLAVKNVGQVVSNNVKIEIIVPRNIGVEVKEEFDMPDRPKRLTRHHNIKIKPVFSRSYLGRVEIDNNEERSRIEIEWEHLQPGLQVWSDVFYIGKQETGDSFLLGSAFADNLPQPKEFELTVSATITKTVMPIDQLLAQK